MRRSLRLPVAIIAAVAVAELGTLLLRPRDLGPDPAAVQARAYFSEQQLDRARTFRDGQLALHGGQLLVSFAVLGLLVWRPVRVRRLASRPVLAGAAAGATVMLAVSLAPLPLQAIARERARDVGLVTQSWGGWAGDLVRAEAIDALLAAGGGAILVLGLRRFGRRWWIPGSAVVIAFGVAVTVFWPVVVDPIFNTFERLPDGPLRTQILTLAERSDVDVGQVYVVDASRRTSGANAYVNGLGHTKRVVLYDNLLRDFERDELRSVVAHELGHVRDHDMRNGLIYFALIVPFGLYAAALAAERLGARRCSRAPDGSSVDAPRAVAAMALALSVGTLVLTTQSNQLSRAVERRADLRALQATDDPQALIDLQRRLAIRNVSDPDPPGWARWLLRTHPTTIERIGVAEAWRRRGEER